MQGEYTGWPIDKDGRLAAAILLNQLSRQLFHDSSKAYATDDRALSLGLKALNSEEIWSQYTIYEKTWLLYPLMHQEKGKYTRQCINELFKLNNEIENSKPRIYRDGTGRYL